MPYRFFLSMFSYSCLSFPLWIKLIIQFSIFFFYKPCKISVQLTRLHVAIHFSEQWLLKWLSFSNCVFFVFGMYSNDGDPIIYTMLILGERYIKHNFLSWNEKLCHILITITLSSFWAPFRVRMVIVSTFYCCFCNLLF